MNQLLLALEEPLVLKVLVHQFSCGSTGHAPVSLRTVAVQCAVRVEDVDHFQVVPLAYFPVVGIVGRGYLNHTGSELTVYIGVGDDWDSPVCQRKLKLLSHNCLVPLIIGVHCNCGIAQKGLGPCGCNLNSCGSIGCRAVCKLIPDVVHSTVSIDVVNLVVGKRCATPWAPVHKVLSFIDKTPLIQGYEYFAYCLGKALVHGKAFPCPVHRGTNLLKLLGDYVVVLLLNLPGALYELLAAQVVLGLALFHEALLHYVLSGDTCVVCSRNPQCRDPLHSIVTDKDILE